MVLFVDRKCPYNHWFFASQILGAIPPVRLSDTVVICSFVTFAVTGPSSLASISGRFRDLHEPEYEYGVHMVIDSHIKD